MMKTIDLFAFCIIVLIIALILFYSIHFRKRENSQHEESEYIPLAAWLRAGIFFCFFYLFSWVTGTMETILKSPIASDEQLANNLWWLWVIGLTAFILVAYWGI